MSAVRGGALVCKCCNQQGRSGFVWTTSVYLKLADFAPRPTV